MSPSPQPTPPGRAANPPPGAVDAGHAPGPDFGARLRRNFAGKLVGEAGSRVISFAFTVVLAQGLGKMAYGRYSVAYAFAGILAMCGELGLNTLLTQRVARDRDAAAALLSRFAPLRWLSVAAVAAGTILLGLSGGDPERRTEIALMALFMAGNTLLDYHTAVFTAFERMGADAVMRVTTRLMVSAAGIAAVVAGAPLVWVIAAVAVANLASASAAGLWRRRLGLSFPARLDPGFMRLTLREAVPVAAASFGIVLYFYMDTLVLEALGFVAADIGQYAAAAKILEAAQGLPLIVIGGVFPVVAQLTRTSVAGAAPFLAWSTRLCVLWGIPLAAVGALLSPGLAALMYGPDYAATGPALALLALAAPLFFSNLIGVYLLLAMERRWEAAWLRGGACLLKVALMVPCTRWLGAAGAALAFLLADGALFLVLLAWRWRMQLLEGGELRLLQKAAMAALAGLGIFGLVRGQPLALQLVACGGTILLALRLLGLLTRAHAGLARPAMVAAGTGESG